MTASPGIAGRLRDSAISALRWAAILAPVAFAIGSASAFFLWSLDEVTDAREDHGWLLFVLPLAGALIGGTFHTVGRPIERGTNLIIDEIHTPGPGVPFRIAPLVLAGTLVTHLFGGSAGREGTAIQMAGGIGSLAARGLHLAPGETRTLLIASVAAGFGAVFGTPLAGTIFSIEVLTAGRFEHRAIVPALGAAFAADLTARAWGAHHTAYGIDLPGSAIDPWLLAKAALMGAFCGLAALLFVRSAHLAGLLARRIVSHPVVRPAVGGAIVIALVFLLGGSRDFLGLGVHSPDAHAVTIVSSFHDGGAGPLSWWWKILFTAITLGFGFKGGEVTPLFFIGSTLGNRLGLILQAPVDLFAGLGFVAVFAGAANTPLACAVMGVELFGLEPAAYLAVACFTAHLASGHRSIYGAQRTTGKKLPAFRSGRSATS